MGVDKISQNMASKAPPNRMVTRVHIRAHLRVLSRDVDEGTRGPWLSNTKLEGAKIRVSPPTHIFQTLYRLFVLKFPKMVIFEQHVVAFYKRHLQICGF